jgi:hypothetical protein
MGEYVHRAFLRPQKTRSVDNVSDKEGGDANAGYAQYQDTEQLELGPLRRAAHDTRKGRLMDIVEKVARALRVD